MPAHFGMVRTAWRAFPDANRPDELEKYVNEKAGPKGATKAKEAPESMRLGPRPGNVNYPASIARLPLVPAPLNNTDALLHS